MIKEYWKYRIQEGDRWDTVAYQFYGDAGMITPIIEANLHIALEVYLPLGKWLYVPVIEIEITTANTTLPPWKR